MSKTTKTQPAYDPARVQRLALLQTVGERVSESARTTDAARQLMRLLDEWRAAPAPGGEADTGDLEALLSALVRRAEAAAERAGEPAEAEGGAAHAGDPQD